MLDLRAARQLATAVMLLGILSSAPPAGAGRGSNSALPYGTLLGKSLEVLAAGSPAARREVAESACSRFEALGSPIPGSPDPGKAAEELRRYLQREKDEWISTRLLEGIACLDAPILRPLFLDALSSPSPNLRWQAFRWFSRVEAPQALPLLERAWPDERRPWARNDLIEALARNRSVRFLEEFRSLAEGPDPEISSTAIGALLLLQDGDSIPFLARLARDGSPWQRRGAADALSLDPESTAALAALLETTHDADSLTRECAVRSLAKREDRTAIARALTVALTDPDEEVRRAGMESLEASPARALIKSTLQSLPGLQGTDRDTVEYRLLRFMGNLQVEATSRSSRPGNSERRSERELRCAYRRRIGCTTQRADALRASPPPGKGSARCFQSPGIPGDPRDYWRVRRGDLLYVYGHFEGHEGPWVRVAGSETPRQCWLPAWEVVPAWAEAPPGEEEGVLRQDFDLPAGETESPAYAALLRGGMIEVIETSDGMPGVSLRIRMGTPDEALLRYAATFPADPLTVDLFWMIEISSSRLCAHPSMVRLAAELGLPVDSCAGSPPSAASGLVAGDGEI